MRAPLAIVVLSTTLAWCAWGQGDTAFTYQGRLHAGGAPAEGPHDVVGSLWDAATGGGRVGGDVVFDDVPVRDGYFSLEFDFGADAFDGGGRWLEITVDGFRLDPRTRVTRSPYALQTRGIFVDGAERVGIGTRSPGHQVHVESEAPELRMRATGADPGDYPTVQLQAGEFPSQFAPLGAVEFYDETGALRGGVYGNKSGGAASQISLSVVPGEVAPLNVASSRVRVRDRLLLVRGTDLESAAELNGDGQGSYLQALGGGLAIGHDSPLAALDVAGTSYFRDRLGIGTSSPLASLDVVGNAVVRQRLGVGVSSPGAALDVLGDSTFRNRLRIGTTTTTMFGQLNIDDSGDGAVFAVSAVSAQPGFPTIYADNEANGPVLWASSAGDVSVGGGGTIVVGDVASANLAMDSNEIMARDNGRTSTLFLNADGGDVRMGEHLVPPAFAYGLVRETGSLVSASLSVTGVQRVSEGNYRVSVAGGSRSGDIMVATIADRVAVIGARVDGSGYSVYMRGNSTGDPIDADFQFVIYRP